VRLNGVVVRFGSASLGAEHGDTANAQRGSMLHDDIHSDLASLDGAQQRLHGLYQRHLSGPP
jgi:hypothetical protein